MSADNKEFLSRCTEVYPANRFSTQKRSDVWIPVCCSLHNNNFAYHFLFSYLFYVYSEATYLSSTIFPDAVLVSCPWAILLAWSTYKQTPTYALKYVNIYTQRPSPSTSTTSLFLKHCCN